VSAPLEKYLWYQELALKAGFSFEVEAKTEARLGVYTK